MLPAPELNADVKSDGDVSVPPVFPFTVFRRLSSPAATVPAVVPTSLVALFPKPRFLRAPAAVLSPVPPCEILSAVVSPERLVMSLFAPFLASDF